MRHDIYSALLASAVLTTLSGCDKENINWGSSAEGKLDCRSLTVDYINSGRQTRADVDINKFTVKFVDTESGATIKSHTYAEMPDIVVLPVGNYKAVASLGDNPVADWEAPYYLGETTFSITAGQITDDISPIVCELKNMRISVNISDMDLGMLGDDVTVTVEAGKNGTMVFDKTTEGKSCYFRYDEGSTTITATLSGTIDGTYRTLEPRIYTNAAPGSSYVINFTVNKPDNAEPGDIGTGGITVDTTIDIRDENKVIDLTNPDAGVITDDMRPAEGGDEPENPDEPTPPATQGPRIEAEAPLVLDKGCNVDDLITGQDDEGNPTYSVKFTVTSETGITGFVINIDSTTLTPDELENVELTDTLDLINPGEYEGALQGLGFATGADVRGKTECVFDISQFVPLLNMLGSGEHKFNLTVTDSNGTSKATVYLIN